MKRVTLFSCILRVLNFPAIVFSSDNFDALNSSASFSAVTVNADSDSVITLQHLYALNSDTAIHTLDLYWRRDSLLTTDTALVTITGSFDSTRIDSLFLSSGTYFTISEPTTFPSFFVGDDSTKKISISISFEPDLE